MTYLFDGSDKVEEMHGEFNCFQCWESTDTAKLEDGVLTYVCPNGHAVSLPWGVQGEIELDDE